MINPLHIIGILLLILFNQCRLVNGISENNRDTGQNRLVVSLIEMDGEIDKETKMEFEKLITDFNVSEKYHIGYETRIHKGGEIDYCFPAGQAVNLEKFVRKVKRIMDGSKFVQLKENTN